MESFFLQATLSGAATDLKTQKKPKAKEKKTFWLLLFLGKERGEEREKKWQSLKQGCQMGCYGALRRAACLGGYLIKPRPGNPGPQSRAGVLSIRG